MPPLSSEPTPLPPIAQDPAPAASVSTTTPVPEAVSTAAPAPVAPPASLLPPHHAMAHKTMILIVILGFVFFLASGIVWYIFVWQAHDPAHQAARWEQILNGVPKNPESAKLTPEERAKILSKLNTKK